MFIRRTYRLKIVGGDVVEYGGFDAYDAAETWMRLVGGDEVVESAWIDGDPYSLVTITHQDLAEMGRYD